jgi:heme/copper-type cytochrome/quinol oxidase subunit 2
MKLTRRTVGALLIGTGAFILVGPAVVRLFAASAAFTPGQDQVPNRREFTVTAKDFHFSPSRLEVIQDDLVKLTVRSEDVAYSLTIDEYRVSKRVPAGGTTTLEFRADRPGTFPFYSNLTNDSRHGDTRGELVVRAR